MTENPFLGASPFGRGDAHRFFGREVEAEQLLRQVLGDRIALIHAPSGSGKSSLIHAMLIPALAQRSFVAPDAPFRPSSIFVGDVIRVELPDCRRRVRSALIGASLGISEETLTETSSEAIAKLRSRVCDDDKSAQIPLLLVVDQTEEIFSHSSSSSMWRRAFFDELSELCQDEFVWLVLAIREDFLARALSFDRSFQTRLASRFAVPLLDVPSSKQVIEKTLAYGGVEVSEKKIEALVRLLTEASSGIDDANDFESFNLERIVEPLFLQLVCSEWWQKCDGSPALLEEFEFSHTKIQAALSRHLDNAFALVPAAMGANDELTRNSLEFRLRVWAEQHLTNGDARQQGRFPPEMEKGVRCLEDAYILRRVMPSNDSDELTHDQLVRALKDSNARWMAARASGEIGYLQYNWEVKGKNASDLLSIKQVVFQWPNRNRWDRELKSYWRISFVDRVRPSLIIIGLVLAISFGIGIFSFNRVSVFQEQVAKLNIESYRLKKDIEERQSDINFGKAQSLLAQSYALSAGQVDLRNAALSALESLKIGKETGSWQPEITARAESALLRLMSLNPLVLRAVDRVPNEIISNVDHLGSKGEIYFCTEGALHEFTFQHTDVRGNVVGVCDTNTKKNIYSVIQVDGEAPLRFAGVSDRVDKHQKNGYGYSFAEVWYDYGVPVEHRRLWLDFPSEALLTKRGTQLDYPPLEINSGLRAAFVDQFESSIYGMSISSFGRLYAWIVKKTDVKPCAIATFSPGTENDICRKTFLTSAISLFADEVIATEFFSSIADSRNDPYYSAYALSKGGELAQARWWLRNVWSGPSIFVGNRKSPATQIFLDAKSKSAWLVNAEVSPIRIGPGARPNPPDSARTAFLLTILCIDVGCNTRIGAAIAKDGAWKRVELDDDASIVADMMHKFPAAQKYSLSLESIQQVGEGGGSIAIMGGSRRINVAKDGHIEGAVEPAFSALLLDLSGVREIQLGSGVAKLAELLGPVSIHQILVFGRRIGLLSSTGRLFVCSLKTSAILVDVQDCKELLLPGIAVSTAYLSVDGDGLLAVGLTDGKIQIYEDESGTISQHSAGLSNDNVISIPSAHLGRVSVLQWNAQPDHILRLVSGGEDGRVKVWLLKKRSPSGFDYSEIPILLGAHRLGVTTMSVDGGTLLTGSAESEVKRWVLGSEDLVSGVCHRYFDTDTGVATVPSVHAPQLCSH